MASKFFPLLIGLKLDLREVVRLTISWDKPVPSDLGNEWLISFLMLEQLKGMNFHRVVMPQNAGVTKMRMITGVGAALDAMINGINQVEGDRRFFYQDKPGGSLPLPQLAPH